MSQFRGHKPTTARSGAVASDERVGQHEAVARPVFDAQRGILAIVGFVCGVVLTKAFGMIGFVAILLLLVVGVPLFAVVSARRSAARSASKQSSQ
jgi:hypothetical protein